MLAELLLADADDASATVEDDRPRRCGALVDRQNESAHVVPPLLRRAGRAASLALTAI